MIAGINEGKSSPLGASLSLDGANFSVYSKHATGIELLLFVDYPYDIVEWNSAEYVSSYAYKAEARSVVILYAGV